MENRIAAIRADKNLRLIDVARKAKTTSAQVQKLERGERRLTLQWMQRLGAAMDVKPSELLAATDVELRYQPRHLTELLEKFIGNERVIAEELAANFLEMLLQYRTAIQPSKSPPDAKRQTLLSREQHDLARSLISMSRNLANALGQAEPLPTRRRSGT